MTDQANRPRDAAAAEGAEARARVAAYIQRRKQARGIDVESIHGFDVGPAGGFELRLSDLEALLSDVQPKGTAGWQPIATAPRDGSEVLIFEVYERLPVIGWWSEKRKRWYASTEVYDTDGDATVIDKLYTDGVTHWMPLPAPPVMDANDDEVQA